MIRPWLASAEEAGVSSSAFTAYEVGELADVADSEPTPAMGWVSRLELVLSGISGSPTTATVFLSHDEIGREAITPNATSRATQTLSVTGDGDSARASAAFNLDRSPYIKLNSVWVWVLLDNGTADCIPRLWGETPLPPAR